MGKIRQFYKIINIIIFCFFLISFSYSNVPMTGNNVQGGIAGVAQRTQQALVNPAPAQQQSNNSGSFNYDANGNETTDDRYTYTYDAENHLTSVVGSGVDIAYFYDGDGLRISRTDNLTSTTTKYIWDDQNPTGSPQVLEEIENGQVVRRYGYGYFLENVDIWNGTSFDRFYCVPDGTKSIRLLLDSAGSVAAKYDYDAFGNTLSVTNINPETANNYYGFQSEYKDPTTGLVYLRARWYDPRIGRFIGMDSDEGNSQQPATLHKYVYTANDPVNHSDPSGQFGEEADIAGVMAYEPTLFWPQNIPNATTGIFSKGYPAAWLSSIPGRHAAVKIIPTNQEKWKKSLPGIFSNFDAQTKKFFATIGAFPDNYVSAVAGYFNKNSRGKMVARINYFSDTSWSATNYERLANNNSEDETIARLFYLTSNYKNDATYTLIPHPGAAEYNSNSFHLGLLNAENIASPSFVKDENGYYGAENVLPEKYFH